MKYRKACLYDPFEKLSSTVGFFFFFKESYGLNGGIKIAWK